MIDSSLTARASTVSGSGVRASSACTCSTVSMMSTPTRFFTTSTTPRRPSPCTIRPVSARPRSIRAMSPILSAPSPGRKRRIVSPTSAGSSKRLHMTTWRRSSALSSTPPVLETLRRCTAAMTSARVTPCSRARIGSTRMRTSGSCRPTGTTSLTASRRSSRSSRSSAASESAGSGPDSSTSTTMAVPGSMRRKVGSSSISGGKSVMPSTAARRSTSAASMRAESKSS